MSQYTLEEILSQPRVWKIVCDRIKHKNDEFEAYVDSCVQTNVVFIGCGTSFYLSLSGAYVYAKITGQKTQAVSASDVLFFPEPLFSKVDKGYMAVLISRSGATTEVLRAAELIKGRFRFPTCALSCRPKSELVANCDRAFVVPEADEKSVVMTRSFTSMLLLIQWLASIKSRDVKYQQELLLLPVKGKEILDKYQELVKEIIHKETLSKFIYLGQGPFYGLACESMLKIKEMSLSSSEAYHTLEFRHGPMSMVDEQMLITFFISEHGRREEIVLLKEMKQLGAKTLVLCERADTDIIDSADYLVELNSGVSDFARLILYMPVTQLLGYYMAIAKGLNPDNPKNLTQVVTLQ